jgi:hypothetical protein
VALCEKSHKRNFVECELSVPQLRCLQKGGRSPGVNACNTCSCKTTFIKGTGHKKICLLSHRTVPIELSGRPSGG